MNRSTLPAVCVFVVTLSLTGTVRAQLRDDDVAAHIRWLKGSDVARKKGATIALGTFGDRAVPAIPALIEVLSDPDLELRRYAAEVLKNLGRPAEGAIPALREMALSDDRYVRERALDAIMKIAPESIADVPSLIVELQSTEMPHRRRAAEMLARLNELAKPALSDLSAALKDESADVRSATVLALANLREQGRPAVDALLVALHDQNAAVRANVGVALTYIGPGEGHGDAIPHLIAALTDVDPAVRRYAAWALSRGWPGEERAVPALVKALADRGTNGTDGAGGHAGDALVDIAQRGHSALVVAAIVEFLKSPPATGQWSAVYALGRIGHDARPAIPVLKTIMHGKNAETIPAAAVALAKIDGSIEPGVSTLLARLHDDDSHVRERAASGLGAIGALAVAAVPELIAQLEDHNVQAVAAFRRAAEQGSPEAQCALALQLRDGLGIAADATAAASWLRKAADQGNRDAQRHLGIFYRQGRGVPRDDEQADAWYRKSVQRGVLERLRYEADSEGAYDEALAYVKHDEVTVGQAKYKLLAAVAIFEHAGGVTRYRYVDTDSFPGGCDMRYDRSAGLPSRYGPRYSPLEMERLKRLLTALPEGIGFAPLAQRVIVSWHADGRWITRLYDAEALPRVVRNLLEFTGLPATAAPYPPQEAASWTLPSRPMIQIAYQPVGALLSWGYDHRIDVWKHGRPADENSHVVRWLPGYPIAVAAATQRVVTSQRRQLRLLNLETGDFVAELSQSTDNNDRGRDAAFSADGRTLVVQDARNRRMLVYDAVTGKRRGNIEIDPSFSPPAVSADGRLLAASVGDKATCVWDLMTFAVLRRFDGFPTTSLAFSPDGTSLAAEGRSGVVVWNLQTGEKRFTLRSGDWAGTVCYSPDGNLLAEMRRRPLVRLYDARDGRIRGIAEGHTGDLRAITSLAFSPDGATFATAGEDGLIKLWNVADVLEDDEHK